MLRESLRRVLNLAERLSATAFLCIPLAILLVGIALYLYQLFQVVLAPGVPVEYTYTANGKSFRLQARSYTLDLDNRRAILTGARLMDERRIGLAEVAWVSVAALPGRFDVRARDGFVRVDRLKGERFSLQDAIPPSTSDEPPKPFRFRGSNLVAHYRDLSASPGLPIDLRVGQIAIDSGGNALRAEADVSIPSGAKVDLAALFEQDEALSLAATFASGDYAAVVPHLGRWLADAAPLRTTRLDLAGKGGLRIVGKKEPEWWANAKLRASGVQWPDYAEGSEVSANLALHNENLSGQLRSVERGRSADFNGLFSWRDRKSPRYDLALQGQLNVRTDSATRLWKPLREAIPRDLAFNGANFDGSVVLLADVYDLVGTLRANQVRYAKEVLNSAVAKVRTTPEGAHLQVEKARYADAAVRGAVLYKSKEKTLAGYVESVGPMAMANLAAKAGLRDVTGRAQARLVLKGTTSRPVVIARLQGSGTLVVADESIQADRFVADAQWSGGLVDVRRIVARGPEGSVAAKGKLNLTSKSIDLDVQASGINLSKWTGEVGGQAFVRGHLAGSFSNPELIAQAQVLGLKAQDVSIPVAKADLRVNKTRAVLSNINAEALANRFRGNLTYLLKDRRIDGDLTAQNLQLADLPQRLGLAGDVSLDQIQVRGTVDDPLVLATISSRRASYQGIKFTNAKADLQYRNSEFLLKSGSFDVGAGRAVVAGNYKLSSKDGAITFRGENLDAAELLRGRNDSELAGVFDADGQAVIRAGKLTDADLKTALRKLTVDGVPLGGGDVAAKLKDGVWTANGQVGDLQRYIIADNLRFNEKNDDVSGKVDVFNFQIANALESGAIKRAIPDPTAQRILRDLAGRLTASVEVSGTRQKPNVNVPLAQVDDFSIAGRPAGLITGQAQSQDGNTRISRAAWKVGATSFTLAGTVGQDGAVALEPSLEKFDSSWLQALFPEIAIPSFEAGFDLVVGGTITNPTVEGASRDITFRIGEGDAEVNPKLLLDTISLRDKVWTLGGQVAALDFSGRITSRIPMSAFTPGARNFEPLAARLELKPRSIDEFTQLIPTLDVGRSEGTLQGFVSVDGSPGDLRFGGEVNVIAKSLGLKNVETALTDTTLKLNLGSKDLTLAARTNSSKGGSMAANIVAIVPTAFGSDFDLKSLLSKSAVTGVIEADQFQVSEKATSRDKRMLGVIPLARIDVSGSLQAPVLAGNINFRDIDFVVPEFAESGPSGEPIINPQFRTLTLSLLNPARIRSSNAVIDLLGSGTIAGTLATPRVDSVLKVMDGTFTLPTARVALEEGGTVRFAYNGSQPDAAAQMVLDMEGRTSVTARRVSDVVERYEVTLRITGDLMQTGGLNIVASSDPPDLTSQEILALLGQKDLIEQIARSATGGAGKNDLRDAALSLALPSLTGGLGQGIASSFGLDYFGIEYNAFDGTVVSAARTLGKNFTVSARRSLANDVRGRARYDVKISWRLPSNNRFLSRTRLGFGFDQDRPWRFSIDYVKRF